MSLLLLMLAGCAGPASMDSVEHTDAADSDVVVDTDAPVPPCEGYSAILDFPGSYSGALTRTDPERWTGQGDKPTELLAVQVPDTSPFTFEVVYPKVSTGTSEKYWMQAVFLDSSCNLRVADATTSGDADHDRVTWIFTPDAPGWWFPMLHFGEALVVNEEVSYTATIAPQ